MTTLASILWAAVAGLCAVGFGVVTGIFHPEEKVNGLWLVVAAACFYVLAYRFYGRFLARRVVELDNRRITPAHRLNDGANFHPTNRWVLFGHHFAAIAGAGPLLGPVLAAQFGYLPGFLWLVVGAVLAGAVQDFIILVASMRRNGRSLPQIARDEIGAVTGLATAIAVLFIVVVALAGLALAVVNALYHNPWGTFTLAVTIPIAFFMGFYLQRWRPGRVGEMSAIGVVMLVAAVIGGRAVSQSSVAVGVGRVRGDVDGELRGGDRADRGVPPGAWRLLRHQYQTVGGGLGSARLPGGAHPGAVPNRGARHHGAPRRRGLPGGWHGVDLLGLAGHDRPDGLLVPVRASVRGAVHSDHDRCRHARCALPRARAWWHGLRAAANRQLDAGRDRREPPGRRKLGLSLGHRQCVHDLADVRGCQPTARHAGPVCGDDGADQDG